MQARLVLLLVLAMAVPSASRAQMTSEPGVILEATPIRIDPAATVPLATLPRGMDVTVLAIQDGWLQVAFEDLRYGRRVGYVPRSTVSFSLPEPPAARVQPPAVAPAPAVAAVSTPATAKPADKRQAAASTTKPAAPAAASTRRPAATAPAATAPAATAAAAPAGRPAPAAAAAKPTARPPVQLVEADFPNLVTPTTSANTPGNTPSKPAATVAAAAPAAVVKPAARPPVQLVEADFPDLVTPLKKPVKASAAAAAKPAPRPPVRLVEAEFPDLVTPPKKTAAAPVARSVVSIGDAFPDAAGSSAEAASNSAQPSAASPAPRPEVRLVHAEFPAIASAAVDAEEPKPASRSVASIGDAFPALAETAPATANDVQLVDGHIPFDLGVDATVFDDRSTDVESVVARVLKHTVLPRVRQVAKTLPQVPGARGIRVLYRIQHHGGAPAAKEYRLELVADMPHVVAFAVAGTTDEAFVAGSTLLVDGNGMRVDLTRVAD